MLEVDGLKISINRGDTGSLTVIFTGQDVPEDGTHAKVIMQKTEHSEEPLWEKLLTVGSGRVTIPFFPEDTDFPQGKYCWILRLLYENGDVYTPMQDMQEFRIWPSGSSSAVLTISTGGDGGGGNSA